MNRPRAFDTSSLVYNSDGLIPAIIQDIDSGQVLMLGYMNVEAVQRTVTEGRVTFWSRSRQEFWRKGDTSGHAQFVRSVAYDCDGDTLLIEVLQVGAACHTGSRSCFDDRELPAMTELEPTNGVVE
jgi:phosphoribosyl-AMP cyclohydrolase